MTTDTLKSPFPYFGGKARIMGQVWTRFGRAQNFVSPFFGGGSDLLLRPIECGAKPGAPWPECFGTETVNDIDALLSNFWRALQHDPEAVAAAADWPVNECVPAGTMIATPNGDVPVEHIRPGMLVWGERDGRIVATRVIATKQSQATELYAIGPLRVTGNHPVWTAERGYQEARLLTNRLHVGMLNWLVDEIDLVMLQYPHERTTMGNLYSYRPTHTTGALCGRDFSRQKAIQRTLVARNDRRQNTSRLLDTLVDHGGITTDLPGYRSGLRRWLAGSGAIADCALSTILQSGQSHRWRGGHAGLHSYAGAAPEMVSNADGRAVSAGSYSCNEGQAPLARSQSQDSSRWHGPHAIRFGAGQDFDGSQGQALICGAKSEAGSFSQGQNAYPRTQTEDRHIDHGAQASALCGNRRNIPLSDRSSAQPGRDRSLGQSGDSEGLPLQRESLSVPVAVYNFETEIHNYFANRILVHNCDLHARHRYLRDRRGWVEELIADPDRYDARLAGWWVWGISQWIGSGWCPPTGKAGRQIPYLNAPGRGNGSGQIGVHADRLARKRPAIGGTGDRTHTGLGVHRASLHAQPRQLPHLQGDSGASGNGIHASAFERKTGGLYAYFEMLAARLRRVRVCCGDWQRVLGPSVTYRHGLTAVFLDPPYAQEGRADVYGFESGVFVDVRQWALENGDNPLLRIALCGYDFEMPEGWQPLAWKAHGGYGSQGEGQGRANAHKEIIWFSPHCIDVAADARASFSQPITVRESDWAGTLFEETS